MLDKFNHLAEAAATNVSRRQVLGRLGRAAAVLAGLFPSAVEAGRGPRYPKCTICIYQCPDGSGFSRVRRGGCAQHIDGCSLIDVVDCGGGV